MERKEPSLDKILEQYYEHIRHTENVRLWFTNMYLLMIGYYFTLNKSEIDNISDFEICILLLLFSILGLIFSLKNARTNNKYTRCMYNIIDYKFINDEERLNYSVHTSRPIIWKYLRLTNVYHSIYIILVLYFIIKIYFMIDC